MTPETVPPIISRRLLLVCLVAAVAANVIALVTSIAVGRWQLAPMNVAGAVMSAGSVGFVLRRPS